MQTLKNLFTFGQLATLSLVAMFAAGCATPNVDLVDSSQLDVKIEVWESRKRISTTKVSYRHRVMGTVVGRMAFAAHPPATPSDKAKIIVKHHDSRHAGQLQDLIEGEGQ